MAKPKSKNLRKRPLQRQYTEAQFKALRSRGWCFTLNNPFLGDTKLDAWIWIEEELSVKARYLIFGFEEGDEKGTLHLQGFAYFKNDLSGETILNGFPAGIHWEPQAGTDAQAICYCMKDLDYKEYGERPRQGQRCDLDMIKYDMVTKKKSMKDIANDDFVQWCYHRRALKEFREMHVKYNTKLVSYSVHSIKDIYRCNLHENSLVTCSGVVDTMYLINEVARGIYEYVFVLDEGMNKVLEQFHHCHFDELDDYRLTPDLTGFLPETIDEFELLKSHIEEYNGSETDDDEEETSEFQIAEADLEVSEEC